MRIPWKLLGLAGVAGVAATGVVVARRRRAQQAYDPAELRERLHRRLAEVAPDGPGGVPLDRREQATRRAFDVDRVDRA